MTRSLRVALAALAALWLAACATTPPPPPMTIQEEYEPETVQVPTPLVEYPPIEPVEPPLVLLAPTDPPQSAPATTRPETIATAPPSIVAVPPATLPPPPAEDVEIVVLLADLQRYGNLGADDIKRELNTVQVTLTRQRTDANRVRLAVLYTLSRANPQDDQRALQLLENVSKSNPGSPAVKQLAFVLQAQISGRQRAVREEQQKADVALQKLEQLRQMERSLLRERARSGGGAGGGGGGGGSGGGGGGGGGAQ